MNRLINLPVFAVALAVALSGCAPVTQGGLPSPAAAGAVGAILDAGGARPPALGQATLVDDKALLVALEAADTLATSVDALVAARVLVPGSSRALAVRDGLVRLRQGLRAASAAQRAGSATTYAEALTLAASAAQEIARAIRGQ